MFYLYVRIYSRSQLMQLEPELMKDLNVRLRKFNANRGGIPYPGVEGLFRYAALYHETLIKAIEAATLCHDYLWEKREALDGFNIILTKMDRRDYDLPKAMEYLVYQIIEDGGIWVDPDCVDEISEILFLEKETCLYRMTGHKQSEPTPSERYARILSNSPVQNRITRWLDGNDNTLLVLRGEEGSGRRLNLEQALNLYLGRESQSVIRLRLNGERDYIYDPFMDSLFAERGEGFSDGENGFLDDLLQGKMLGRCSDFFADDFEEAYIQFLTEKKKRADFQSQPLYLIIEDGEKFSIQSKRFLDRILRMEEFRIIIITSEENPSFIPERKELSEITFPSLTGEEAAARLRLAFPQVEWDREKREQLEKLSRSNPEQLFFAAWLLSGGEFPESGGDMRLQLIDRLDDEEKRLFYFILIGQGLIRQDILIRLFSSVDEEFLVTERIRRLLSLQLVRCNSRDELYAAVTDYPVEGELKKSIVKQVIGQLSGEETIHPFRYFEFLEKQSVLDEALHYLKSIMTWLINNGFHNKAQSLIKTPPFSGTDIDRESRDTLQNLLVSNRLRLALQDREGSELADLVSGGLLSLVSERGEFAEDFFIQLSRYFYCRGNTEQTVNYAKNALYLFQKQGNHLGEGLANMELAFAYLGQKKIQMAMDYFEIARRISYQIEDNYTLISAQTFSALTAFLFGNISKSEDIITQTLELAELNGCRRRTFFLNFLAGRIQFEYGHYKEGAELFEKCWRESENIDMNGGRETARRWIGRCLLYQEKRRDAFRWLDSEDQSLEGLFILAEADFMVSLYESALKRLEQALDTPHDRALSYTERDIWCDGFMPIEGRLSSEEQEEDVLTRQIETLYSYILALSGRHDEGARFFPKGLNQDDYPFKPYSYQYSYIYFTILNVGEITANSDDHRLAALSKAIERLHSRGGRFDNQHKKLDFLNKNWWNKKIMDEAHKKKFF